MRQREDELKSLGVLVLVVTFELDMFAQAYVKETQLAWPLLLDKSRELYRAYGMERGRWWNLYGPASIWVYLKLMVRGRRPRLPTGDASQLGGDVLIDPQGIVRLHHIGSGPADRPTIKSLMDIARQGQVE